VTFREEWLEKGAPPTNKGRACAQSPWRGWKVPTAVFSLAVTSVTAVTEKRTIPPLRVAQCIGSSSAPYPRNSAGGITKKLVTAVTERPQYEKHGGTLARSLIVKSR